MTKEQWLVYLWSIYPDWNMYKFYIFCLIVIPFIIPIGILAANDFNKKELIPKIILYVKRSWIALLVLLGLSKLIPDRNSFFLIVSTPTVVKSYTDDNGTLRKTGKLFENTLDIALKKTEALLKEK